MKTIKFTLTIFLLTIIVGCTEKIKKSSDDLITVDVTKRDYPKKDLILQDFMDVEYVALETNDDFVNQGFVQDIGKNFILVINRNDDGNIFVYDRSGKSVRKINHKGQSGTEYTDILGITLDEDMGEMFVNDLFARKIVVYDLFGNFKRSFKHQDTDRAIVYTDILNYDKENLMCYDYLNKKTSFFLISKEDGSITKEIEIPVKQKLFLRQQLKDEVNDMVYTVSPGEYSNIIPSKDGLILLELSSDTIYTLLPNNNLTSIIVRNPPIQNTEPQFFLILRLISDRYYFMETIKNVYDFNTKDGFPRSFMMYDEQEKAMFNYTVYNGDFSIKKVIYMDMIRLVNHEIGYWYPLEAYQLLKSFEKGELKGKLKEIASTLDEDSNPIIMLIKHKK
ncbi:6-bladed beta-propeller [Petrimonas sulfuriphila]|uniref:6-bladed beta-propeller n=1 Tax=Petrimonas sulfuriphila TaxID=285070 RepID=UPI0032502F83